MTMCPHGHGELDSAGNCPKQNLHVKARVGIACPLCGGPAHKRETDATTQQLQCAWRQYTRFTGMTGMLPLDATNARGFTDWLYTGARTYGREAQYQALAAAGTPLSEAMAKDAARYTPSAPVVAAPVVVAAPMPEAQHTATGSQETTSPGVYPTEAIEALPITANIERLAEQQAETPDERRARLRQALAS